MAAVKVGGGGLLPGIAPGGGLFSCARSIERMNDLTPSERLVKLRALEEWLAWQLGDTRRKIRQLEADQERERKAAARAWAEARFKLEPVRGEERRSVLHRGGCGIWKGEHGFLDRQEALLALEDESMAVEECSVCNPGPALRG